MRLALALLLVPALGAGTRNQVFEDFTTPLPLRAGETLVLGVVGGWESWNNPSRLTRRIALQIRDLRLPGVFVETVENHRIERADELIQRAFPDPARTRLILFGHSLGGRETIRLCRRLRERGAAVLLAVIIDAVGREDYTIPPNVRAAANLYQRSSHWPVRGVPEIRAADPARTRILGKWQYRYAYWWWSGKKIAKPARETGIRWRWMGGHLRMEYDPEVWDHVRRLIVAALSESRPDQRPKKN